MEKATRAKVKKTEGNVVAKKATKPTKSTIVVHGVGRRKSAVARVWLSKGKGDMVVNGKTHSDYFDSDITKLAATMPFRVYPSSQSYDVMVNVQGGGLYAQADAVKLGFARAILAANPTSKAVLRENGLLTVDSRLKERKKYGQKAARRKFQFVKR